MLPYGNNFTTKYVPRMRWRYVRFARFLVEDALPAYERTQTAWLIPDGDEIRERVYVRVPVRRGVKRAYSVEDMDTDLWMDCGRGAGSPVTDMSVHSVHVRHFYPGEPQEMLYTYSIVVTSQRTRGGLVHPPNDQINSLIPGLTTPWRGNVLIFRHGVQPGKPIINISDTAVELIRGIIIKLFREESFAQREDMGGHAV